MARDGDKSVDVLCFGESMVLFAADEPGKLDQARHFSRSLAGSDSNVAIGLSRLGFNVGWSSRVGDDPFGRFIVSALTGEGVACDRVAFDSRRPTGIMFKSRRDDGGDPTILYRRAGSAASALSPEDLPVDCFKSARHLHVTGVAAAISESARALCHHAMDEMRVAGGTISFDPNLRVSLWPDAATMARRINGLAVKADWVLPGIDEGEILTGSRDPAEIADFYLSAGVSEVAIKLGPDGAYWRSADKQLTVPGQHVENVVDTVGAGDAFAVGYISARLENLKPVEVLQRANAIAARVIGFVGDSEGLPRRGDLPPRA